VRLFCASNCSPALKQLDSKVLGGPTGESRHDQGTRHKVLMSRCVYHQALTWISKMTPICELSAENRSGFGASWGRRGGVDAPWSVTATDAYIARIAHSLLGPDLPRSQPLHIAGSLGPVRGGGFFLCHGLPQCHHIPRRPRYNASRVAVTVLSSGPGLLHGQSRQ